MNELAVLIDLFPLLPEPISIVDEWRRLVTRYQVAGKNTYNARLVAAMRSHGTGKILTFNVQDFARYKEIEALHPEAVGLSRFRHLPFPDNPVTFIQVAVMVKIGIIIAVKAPVKTVTLKALKALQETRSARVSTK